MKTVHCVILCLVITAGVKPSHAWCWNDVVVVGGGAVAGVVAGPALVSATLGAVGFSAAGTAAGSVGAAFMSTYGGSIAAGSAVSLMQYVGAAGVGIAGQALGGAVGGAAAYAVGGGNCDPKKIDCENN